MVYLFDTNAFSDFMRENQKMSFRIGKLTASDRVAISVIVRGETLFGLERMPLGKRRDETVIKAQRAFTVFDCEPVPVAAGDLYATTKRARQIAGLPLDENDLWIAVTALAMNGTLVSRDKDFAGVTGLMIEDWTA